MEASSYGMAQDLLWLQFHFLPFLVVACPAKLWGPIHQLYEPSAIASLLQFSTLAGLLLKCHTCNEIFHHIIKYVLLLLLL